MNTIHGATECIRLSRQLFKSSAIQLHNFQIEPLMKSLRLIPISLGLKLDLVEYQV
jgi:hypothetical protein